MDSFGLDISEQSIKYGKLSNTIYGLRLSKFGTIKIPSGIVVSGKIQDEDKLVEILKDLKLKQNLNFVRVSLPEEQMYLFSISLPKMDEDSIFEAILLQIEEHVPLKATETIFDYEIISQNENTITLEVSAIGQSVIESYLSVFNKASLVPVSFELEAQAIARATVPSHEKGAFMIVDFGEARTGISICCDGKVLFTTTIDLGGITITNMIAKNFNLTFDQAEEKKLNYGISASPNTEEILPTIISGLSVLRDELDKSFIYWQTHQAENGISNSKIDRIILCGGDSNLVGIADYLETSIKVKVEHANAWVNISDMKTYIPEMPLEESLSYVTVLGLALGDYTYDKGRVVNVLPNKEKKLLKAEYWRRFIVMSLHITSFLGILAVFLLLPSYFFSSSKESLVESNLEKFNIENKDLASVNIDSTIGDINSKLSLLSKNRDHGNLADTIVSSLIADRVSGIKINRIVYTDKGGLKTLGVDGVASDRDTLRNFKLSLESDKNFSNINIPISNFLGKSDSTFNITMKVN
jgi:type IV pilus assembly protein PilM